MFRMFLGITAIFAVGIVSSAAEGTDWDAALAGFLDDWGADIAEIHDSRPRRKSMGGAPKPLEADALHFLAKGTADPAVIRERAVVSPHELTALHPFPDIDPLQEATPLHIAAIFNDNPDVLKALVEAGVDVDIRESDAGVTPLMAAIYADRPLEVVETLLTLGANVNAKALDGDYKGVAPLHIAAARSTRRRVIQALVEAGGDVAATYRYGFISVTPKMALERAGDERLQADPRVLDLLTPRQGARFRQEARPAACRRALNCEICRDLRYNTVRLVRNPVFFQPPPR